MPVYGYPLQLGIIICRCPALFRINPANVALAMGIAFTDLPFLFWLGGTHPASGDLDIAIALIVPENSSRML